MKQLKLTLLALFTLLLVNNVSSQDEENPWVLGVGFNAVDIRTYTYDFGTNIDDLLGRTEWAGNTVPMISRFTVERYLNKGFTVQLGASFNKINTIILEDDVEDVMYYSLDALLKYDLNKLFGKTGWFDPYAALGFSFQSLNTDLNGFKSNADGMFTGALGFNTWFNDRLGLNFQTIYKNNFKPSGYDVFQHSLGLVVKLGDNDLDGDGVKNKFDECPKVQGLQEFNGCPDTDADGIKDSEDECPLVPGTKELKGCPDPSKNPSNCPDTDGDGIVDKDDKCPTVPGPIENIGCPWTDTDGDTVLDKDDKCPNEVGTVKNNGCPEEITKEDEDSLDKFAKQVLFDTAKSSFKVGVPKILDGVVEVINKYSNTDFVIEGHTDSVGTNEYNDKLSKDRAFAVRDYLVSKGVNPNRLSAQGFGEEKPIATNSTVEGRAQNRRVVIKLSN